ncbi:hypothetical protein [Pseudomonas sp. BF-R-01]|uniref:hypothetical protein n=1 Tax=Pseudomonas sp. BF-R-01 TaxID=2832365 RepID=UPI001CC1774E|nr:hypothetical protein [Pseudomonas sp. BF-R-01]
MLLHEKPFCWFCRTAITDPIPEDPNDCAYIDIVCRNCHKSRRDHYCQIFIPYKTCILIAAQDWHSWSNYLAFHKDQEIDCIAKFLSPASKARLDLAVSETCMGDDIPEGEQGLSSFDFDPEEYVLVTQQIEAALVTLTDAIRSGAVDPKDHQLEQLIALDLGI